jgi:hypothetical protein
MRDLYPTISIGEIIPVPGRLNIIPIPKWSIECRCGSWSLAKPFQKRSLKMLLTAQGREESRIFLKERVDRALKQSRSLGEIRTR